MSNTKEVRLSDFIFECQNVQHTKDWYDLTRECYECALMEQFMESVQFVAENANHIFDESGDYVFEEGVFFDEEVLFERKNWSNEELSHLNVPANILKMWTVVSKAVETKNIAEKVIKQIPEEIDEKDKAQYNKFVSLTNDMDKKFRAYFNAMKEYQSGGKTGTMPQGPGIVKYDLESLEKFMNDPFVKNLGAMKGMAAKQDRDAAIRARNAGMAKGYQSNLRKRQKENKKTGTTGVVAAGKELMGSEEDSDGISAVATKKKIGLMQRLLNFFKKVITGIVNFFKKIAGKLDADTVKVNKIRTALKKGLSFADASEASTFAKELVNIAVPGGKALVDLSYVPNGLKGLKIPTITQTEDNAKLEKMLASKSTGNTPNINDIVSRIIGTALTTDTVTLGVKNESIVKPVASPNDNSKELALVSPNTLESSVKKIGGASKNELYSILTTFEKEWAAIKNSGYDIDIKPAEMQKIADSCAETVKDLDKKIADLKEDPSNGVTFSTVDEMKKLYGAISNVSGNMMNVYSKFITFRTNTLNYLEKFVDKKVSSK